MKKLLILALALVGLTGCAGNTLAPTLSTSSTLSAKGWFASFQEEKYAPVSFETLGTFWSREGCAANDGKKYRISGRVSAHGPENFTEGWTATISSGEKYEYILSGKYFLSRNAGQRYVDKLAAGKEETVTVFFTVKQASSTKDRLVLDAVKRADGTLTTL